MDFVSQKKSTFKIYEHSSTTTEFPKTDFIVTAGTDFSNAKDVSAQEQIEGIENLSNALRNIPNVVVDVIEHENETQETVGKTITYQNGTKEIVNKTGTYKITSDDNP